MSKYNNITSIPIEEIPKEELAQAIKEWAEDDESMEKLLWACYNNGIKTNGCHAGAYPYIGFEYDKEINPKLGKLFYTALLEKGSQIMGKPDGGNPFSGPSWYLPDIGINFDKETKTETDQILDSLRNSLENSNEHNHDFTSFLKLNSFMVGKYTNVSLRLQHRKEDDYVFLIEKTVYEKDNKMFQELNDLFTKTGLELIEKGEEQEHKYWLIKADNIEDIMNKIDTISENIINNYSIEKPKSKEETSSLIIQAHLKRDECIKEGNESGFDLWLMQENERIEKEMSQNEVTKQNNNEKKI